MLAALLRLAVATAFAASSLGHAGEPVQLNKEETHKALAGKSITYEAGAGYSGSVVIFFAAGGRMTLKLTNSLRASSGTWSVDDDGRYCIKIISGTASDGCRHLLKTDTGYAMKTGRGEIVPIDKLE